MQRYEKVRGTRIFSRPNEPSVGLACWRVAKTIYGKLSKALKGDSKFGIRLTRHEIATIFPAHRQFHFCVVLIHDSCSIAELPFRSIAERAIYFGALDSVR